MKKATKENRSGLLSIRAKLRKAAAVPACSDLTKADKKRITDVIKNLDSAFAAKAVAKKAA